MNSSDLEKYYSEGLSHFSDLKDHLLRLLPFWIAGSLTALMATSYAWLFAKAEHLSLVLFAELGLWFILIPPLAFSLSWFLVEKFAPFSNGSGIPQLMASVELAQQKKFADIDILLNFKIIVVKIVSSITAVLGGGAIGREGPTLQISSSIFQIVAKRWSFSQTQNRSTFLLAGAASGLASAFNTPLGGIVYVIEELAKSHLSSFRTGVLHAVIFAGIISQMIVGSYLYFGFPKLKAFQAGDILFYLAIAIFATIATLLFSETLKKIVLYRASLKSSRRRFWMALLSGLIFSLLVVFVSSNGLGSGKDFLEKMLFENYSASIQDLLSRFAGTLFTYSSGGAGGIFAPILSIGGSAASFFDRLLNLELGSLAVVIGMTAALASLTHSPLTSFILILEMTDRHTAIFPLMLAAAIGHGLSKYLQKKSFYEFVAERILNGIIGENKVPHQQSDK